MGAFLRHLVIAVVLVSGVPPAGGARAAEEPRGIDLLLDKAEHRGSVRAIVGLDVPFRPEGKLSVAGRRGQREDIKSERSALSQELAGTGFETVRRYASLPYVALELTPDALQAVRSSPHATTVQEDTPVPPLLTQSVPLVQGDLAVAAGYDGTGQTVAIVDTGVDASHEFVTGKVVEEACYSGGSDCPNGMISQTGAGAGAPCTYAPTACRHGTHVAGIAAGSNPACVSPNPCAGVAPGASLMAIQVFSGFSGPDCAEAGEDPCALSFPSDQIAALQRVYALRATYSFAAVNMSLGGGAFTGYCDIDNPSMKTAIDNLRSVGVATVVASGNNGLANGISEPACISTAVSVGSTTKTDVVSGSFSNSAKILSLLAPGSSITSSLAGGGYLTTSGTSMAAPHVAGAWAVLKDEDPSLTVERALSALQNTGKPILDARNGLTKPRIEILDATPWTGLPNDPLAGAVATGSLPFSVTDVYTTDATKEPTEPTPACTPSTSRTVWYGLSAPADASVIAETAGSHFDTVLGVWTGSSLATLTPVACSDDVSSSNLTSRVQFAASAGVTYLLQVGGFGGDSGGLRLALSEAPVPPSPPPTVSPPLPGPEKHGRSVSLRLRKHLVARGLVSAGDGFPACFQGQAVTINRKVKSGWKAVRTAVTTATGSYRIRLPDRAGTYHAALPESEVCSAALSALRTHRP